MADHSLVREVVLTGGPCAGKSSSLKVIGERLRDEGYRPIVVPEWATVLFTATSLHGCADAEEDRARYVRIQSALMSMQRQMRREFTDLARLGPDAERAVVIYDRAEMDISAYMRPDEFAEVLAEHRIGIAEARDSYTGVVHLRSTAVGAERFYTRANNPARRENVDMARVADARTLQAWSGHRRLRVIGNGPGGFPEKLDRVTEAVLELLA